VTDQKRFVTLAPVGAGE